MPNTKAMSKIKILHTISQLGNGGRERRMVQLVKGLDRTGKFSQYIITFSNEIEYSEILNTSAEIIFVDYKSLSKFGLLLKVKQIISQIRPSIVHSWNGGVVDIFLSLLKPVYKYTYIAGFVADGNRLKSLSKAQFIHKLSFYFADIIISNSIAGLHAKNAPFKKSRVIYNGYDFKRLENRVQREQKLRELNIYAPHIVGMIARVSAAKDFNSFIDLASKSKEILPTVHYLAIGGGEMLQECRNRIAREGLENITFLGNRRDVEELLQIMSLSVLFSNDEVHAEGVSNSIMESMAEGIPVIATRGGGTPEIITDSVNGYIIEPKDSSQALRHIVTILKDSNLYNRLSNNARQTIKEQFTLDQMTSKYIELYNDLLK